MPSVALVYNTKSETFEIRGSGEYHYKPRAGFVQVITTLSNIEKGVQLWAIKNKPNLIDSKEDGLEYLKKIQDVIEYHKKTGFYTPEAEEKSLSWKEGWKEVNYGPQGRCPCCNNRIKEWEEREMKAAILRLIDDCGGDSSKAKLD